MFGDAASQKTEYKTVEGRPIPIVSGDGRVIKELFWARFYDGTRQERPSVMSLLRSMLAVLVGSHLALVTPLASADPPHVSYIFPAAEIAVSKDDAQFAIEVLVLIVK